jgi:hypothetical protein
MHPLYEMISNNGALSLSISYLNSIAKHSCFSPHISSPLFNSPDISSTYVSSLCIFSSLLCSFLRLDGYRLELRSLKDVQNNQEKEKASNRTFPCGYCRTVLSSATCVVSENRHLNTLFNYHLEAAIKRETEAIEESSSPK